MKLCILTENKKIIEDFAEYFPVYTSITDCENYEVVILISYGKLIPDIILKNSIYLNVHNSILPKYRGLHAFTWAIINGETELGYTLHTTTNLIDGGKIICQEKFKLKVSENINDAFIKGSYLLNKWLIPLLTDLTLLDIKNAKKQNEQNVSYVTRRKVEDNLINWDMISVDIHNLVRAVAPPYTNGAYTFFNNTKVYILETELLNTPNYIERVGKIVNITNNQLCVKTSDNIILVKKYIFENKDDKILKVGNSFKGIME